MIGWRANKQVMAERVAEDSRYALLIFQFAFGLH
jgi:hypothetical protein